MRSTALAALALAFLQLSGASSSTQHSRRDFETREYYAVELGSGTDPAEAARELQLEYEGPLGELPGHHIFYGPKGDGDVVENYRRRRRRRSLGKGDIHIVSSAKQRLKKLHKRIPPPPIHQTRSNLFSSSDFPEGPKIMQDIASTLGIKDPLFQRQWHLFNTEFQGHDTNATGLWLEGITGANVTVAVIDDGIDMRSDDLKDNYFAEGSWDFNDPGPVPDPKLPEDSHGTRCAGEIAAVKNNVCGIGVAYDSKVAGIRILSKQISDIDEAIALNYKYQKNHIYSCSWGPPDDGKAMEAPSDLIVKAIMNGVQNGRGGLGSVFVFASGNGANRDDNCNFDGYTNSIYSITIGAIDHQGRRPYYSEACSANMAVTYSSGGSEAIHTTDVTSGGKSACYDQHGGTSAAAPLAAGILALVLSVRPDLSWRDLQALTIKTAIPVNTDDPDWVETATGVKYNHKYGYGKLDAYTMAHAAETFQKLKPQAWYHSPLLTVNREIPEGGTGLRTEIIITEEQLKKANLERVEQVTVTMNARHSQRGEMSVDLISPAGLVSTLATNRKNDFSSDGYQDWTFMTVKHWGESGVGTWAVVIKDHIPNEEVGTLVDWKLNLWGEAIDPAKAVNHPYPGDQSPPPGEHPTSTPAAVTTTSVSAPHPDTKPTVSAPDSHIERPTKKPSVKPTPTGSPVAEESDKPNSGFLWSVMPSFGGFSKTTQAWIGLTFGAIVLFIAGLGVYMYKKARRDPEDRDYEFQQLNAEDLDDATDNEDEPGSGGGPGKTRDLYDAFRADDEEEDFYTSDEEGQRGSSPA